MTARKARPRNDWSASFVGPVLDDDDQESLALLADEIGSDEQIRERIKQIAVTYRLFRRGDPGEDNGSSNWQPQAPRQSEINAALKELSEALWHVLQLLEHDEVRRALANVGPPMAALDPVAGSRSLIDLYTLTTAARLQQPDGGGRRPLDSLRLMVRELAGDYVEATGKAFSVGGDRQSVLNTPADWVARVVKAIDDGVTDANLRTVFRQDFSTMQIDTPLATGESGNPA